MLCPSVFQSSPFTTRSLLDPGCPVPSPFTTRSLLDPGCPVPSPFTTRSLLDPGCPVPSAFTTWPLMDPGWPVRSLWPETRPLLHLVEREVMRHLLEMRQSLEHMEQLHQRVFEEIDRTWSRSGVFQTVAVQQLGGRDGGGFTLSLDTAAFAPEELSVKQVGRRLRVSGRTERKQEDAPPSSSTSSSLTSSSLTSPTTSSSSSCSSYRSQEFRQEFQLPDGVDPEAVTCSLVGGQLQIQAPQQRAMHDGKERLVPISLTSAPAITSSTSTTSTSSSTPSSSAESSPAEKKTEN